MEFNGIELIYNQGTTRKQVGAINEFLDELPISADSPDHRTTPTLRAGIVRGDLVVAPADNPVKYTDLHKIDSSTYTIDVTPVKDERTAIKINKTGGLLAFLLTHPLKE